MKLIKNTVSDRMIDDLLPSGQPNRIVLYNAVDGKVTVNVFFARDNFWLPQRAIAELFGVGIAAISKHLKNIYESGELTTGATISKWKQFQSEGDRQVTRVVEFYKPGRRHRRRLSRQLSQSHTLPHLATNTLREFVVKGFVINDEMLKNGRSFGQDYFDELLEKIREIRASERRAYQKIADVFEQCSSDYRSSSEETQLFYQMFRTGFISPALARPQRRLSLNALIAPSHTWGLPLGRIHPRERF